MLNEDKVSHRSHVILTAVKKHRGVRVKENDERVLKEIKRLLATELAQEQETDHKVKAKLASYSRNLVESSAELDVLYRKTFEENAKTHCDETIHDRGNSAWDCSSLGEWDGLFAEAQAAGTVGT
jgi:hypothetical protein